VTKTCVHGICCVTAFNTETQLGCCIRYCFSSRCMRSYDNRDNLAYIYSAAVAYVNGQTDLRAGRRARSCKSYCLSKKYIICTQLLSGSACRSLSSVAAAAVCTSYNMQRLISDVVTFYTILLAYLACRPGRRVYGRTCLVC